MFYATISIKLKSIVNFMFSCGKLLGNNNIKYIKKIFAFIKIDMRKSSTTVKILLKSDMALQIYLTVVGFASLFRLVMPVFRFVNISHYPAV